MKKVSDFSNEIDKMQLQEILRRISRESKKKLSKKSDLVVDRHVSAA
jgi:hypothetical protein